MSGQGQGLTWHAARLVGQREKRELHVSVYALDDFFRQTATLEKCLLNYFMKTTRLLHEYWQESGVYV